MHVNTIKFWMVWGENGGAPSHRHVSVESAQREAERLAKVAPGQKFYVLEAKKVSVKMDTLTFELHDEEVPF